MDLSGALDDAAKVLPWLSAVVAGASAWYVHRRYQNDFRAYLRVVVRTAKGHESAERIVEESELVVKNTGAVRAYDVTVRFDGSRFRIEEIGPGEERVYRLVDVTTTPDRLFGAALHGGGRFGGRVSATWSTSSGRRRRQRRVPATAL